jgi:hypothetical protein
MKFSTCGTALSVATVDVVSGPDRVRWLLEAHEIVAGCEVAARIQLTTSQVEIVAHRLARELESAYERGRRERNAEASLTAD